MKEIERINYIKKQHSNKHLTSIIMKIFLQTLSNKLVLKLNNLKFESKVIKFLKNLKKSFDLENFAKKIINVENDALMILKLININVILIIINKQIDALTPSKIMKNIIIFKTLIIIYEDFSKNFYLKSFIFIFNDITSVLKNMKIFYVNTRKIFNKMFFLNVT